jgi:hypothetical protein
VASVRLPEQRRKMRLKSRQLTLKVDIAEKRETLRQTNLELAALRPAKKKE